MSYFDGLVPAVCADINARSKRGITRAGGLKYGQQSVAPKDHWQQFLINQSSCEYERQQSGYGTSQNRLFAQSEIIRYALREDYCNLVALVRGFIKKSDYQFGGQFYATVLVVLARGFRRNSETNRIDSRDALALFYSVISLLEEMHANNDYTKAAWILLLSDLQEWSNKRKIDERSCDIDRIIIDLHRNIGRQLSPWEMPSNLLLFTSEDEVKIEKRAKETLGHTNFKRNIRDSSRYTDTDIIDDLNSSVGRSEYHGSPFVCHGITVGDYMRKFMEQLKLESDCCLRVANMSGDANTEHCAEELIEKWNWFQALKNSLIINISNLKIQTGKHLVKDFLSILDINEIAECIYSSALSLCSLGQKQILYEGFEIEISKPIFKKVHQKFIRKFLQDKTEVAKNLYAEYIRYFVEADIPRCHTLREWWLKCSLECRVDPRYSVPFTEFSVTHRRDLGAFLNHVMIQACRFQSTSGKWMQAFHLKNASFDGGISVSGCHRISVLRTIIINSRLMRMFSKHEFKWIVFPSDLVPMKVPPRPWIDYGFGGPSIMFPSDIMKPSREYPHMMTNREMKKRLRSKSQARPVFDALNNLGATPWKINNKVLATLFSVIHLTADSKNEDILRKLSIPLQSSAIDVSNFDLFTGSHIEFEKVAVDVQRKFLRQKFESMKKKRESNSLWYWLKYRAILAKHFRNGHIFFPHNMDFRGRVYPVSPYLSHMGDDLNRSLLLFAQGKPLGKNGLSWLKIHCINLNGRKKESGINERLDFANVSVPEILDSANRPIDGRRWWMDSDEPWQNLATCIEIDEAIKSGDPESFISFLPVHQDGSCNGLQHYAALGRDEQGGKEVNLLPSEAPSDVYSIVARRVEELRTEDEKSDNQFKELATALREAYSIPIPRKVIKQTVMTTVYGVTLYGARLQIRRQLKALNLPIIDCGRFGSYLARLTFKSLHDAFTSSMKIKDWFRLCAGSISNIMQPVEWITPLGLPVVQPYMELVTKSGQLCLAPVKHKQVNAFPPNFIHSLDSTHMMLTSLHSHRMGITFAAVHDCYWTHAATVEIMNSLCREQFIRLHKQPIITDCAKFFQTKYLSKELVELMNQEKLENLKAVFSTQIETGSLNIDDIRNSVYFFS